MASSSMMFMTWKVPTRLIVSEPSYVKQKEKLINQSNQHFYEDINGEKKQMSIHHDVLDGVAAYRQKMANCNSIKHPMISTDTTLTHQIRSPTSTTHHSPPYHMFKHIRGQNIENELKQNETESLPKLPQLISNSASNHSTSAVKACSPSAAKIQSPPAKVHSLTTDSNNMKRLLQPRAVSAAHRWIQSASDRDRAVLNKMMKEVDNQHMDNTLNEALKPGAKKAVEKWLENANEKDRAVAIKFFSSLAGSKLMGVREGTFEACNICDGSRLKQVLDALHSGRKATISVPKDSKLGNFTRQQPRIRLLSPNTRANKKDHQTWHHLPVFKRKEPVRNTIGLFTRPHRPIPRHFVIHPEWE